MCLKHNQHHFGCIVHCVLSTVRRKKLQLWYLFLVLEVITINQCYQTYYDNTKEYEGDDISLHCFCPQKSEGTHNQAIEQFLFCQPLMYTAVQHKTLPFSFPYKRFRTLLHVYNNKFSKKVDGIAKFKLRSHFNYYLMFSCTALMLLRS
jgi:hypothetical protein